MSVQWERNEQQKMADMAELIRYHTKMCTYDYREFLPQSIKNKYPHIAEDYHVAYGKNRYAVAQSIQPENIFEVGVGWGISAMAFLAGCPTANYIGIDNGDIGDIICPYTWVQTDSDLLEKFVMPDNSIPDLIHIDGSHDRAHKKRDCIKAIQSGAEWMLVDDMHSQPVAAGTFDAFFDVWDGSCIPMAVMENSHTQGMLFHIGNRGKN